MGVGTNTVMIALSSFLIAPKLTIVLTSFVSIFGGIGMLRLDKGALERPYWIPITTTMLLGGVCGAIALNYIDITVFQILLGSAFLIVSFSMLIEKKTSATRLKPPKKAKFIDVSVGWFSGFLNGFIGLSAVPLIAYFGKILNKKHLRRLLVLIYLPVSIAQTLTFALNGMLSLEIILYGIAAMIFIAPGLYVGNKAHAHIPDTWFKRILGIFLIFASVKFIYSALT